MNDEELDQNVMIRKDKKKIVDSHYVQILRMQIYVLTKIYL